MPSNGPDCDFRCGKEYAHLFLDLFKTDDILSFVVRGHLYCEASLNQLLQNSLKSPDEIDIDRLDYGTKVDFCAAMGLFSFDVTSGLKQLGKLRNKIVHDLEYKISEQDQLDFINTLKSTIDGPAKHYLSIPDKMEFPNGLRRCIICLWLHLQLRDNNLKETEDNLLQISYVALKISGMDEKEFLELCKEREKKYFPK